MNYKKYIKECEGKTHEEILSIAVDSCRKIDKACQALGVNSSWDQLFYYAALVCCFSDKKFDSKEIKFINSLNDELCLGEEKLTISSAKAAIATGYSQYRAIVAKLYKSLDDICLDESYYELYKAKTNKMKMNELFIRYVCALLSANGTIEEAETELVEGFINGTFVNDLVESSDSSDAAIDEPAEEIPPSVIKVGGSLYSDEYNKYFSVGAEILIEGSDACNLDVRVQLLDSSGFILESFDENISYVKRGTFRFGKEYYIHCNPTNFKVIVGATERGTLEEDYVPDNIFKCTGMRFTRNGDYYNTYYDLACMVENIGLRYNSPTAEVYVVFYDAADNIVGGACLNGESLYYGQPDRYDTRIDCVSVVNKTHTFRWCTDVYYRG